MKPKQAAIVLFAQREILRQQHIIDAVLEDVELPPTAEEVSNRQRFNNTYEIILAMVANPTPYEDKRFVDGNTPVLPIQVDKDGGELRLFLQLGVTHDIEGKRVTAVWSFEPNDDENSLLESMGPGFINEDDLNNLEWSLDEYIKALGDLSDEELLDLGLSQDFIDHILAGRT